MPKSIKGKKAALLAGLGVLLVLGLFIPYFYRWIQFFREFKYLGKNEWGRYEFLHRETEVILVCIPGKTFIVGSTAQDFAAGADERPQHPASLSSFLIARYELSQ